MSGKRRRTRISIFFKSTMKWINFIFPQECRRKTRALSSSTVASRRTDERKVSTAEYLKLWKVVNLVASLFFFSSFRRGFVRSSKPDKKLLLRRPSCRCLRARNSELKRSFVKKVSTIYSPFFLPELRTEILSSLSSVTKWIINDLYKAS